MKKLLAVVLAAPMMMIVTTAFAEEETNMNWAYGALPLNNGTWARSITPPLTTSWKAS